MKSKKCNHEKQKTIPSIFRNRKGEIISLEITICSICNQKVADGNKIPLVTSYI